MITTPIFYSTLFFSLLAILSIVLAFLIVRVRQSEQIGLGDGDNAKMRQRIRVQGNYLEYLLPFSLLFLVYELNNGNEIILITTGSLFLFARIIHPLGLLASSGYSKGRYFGTLITWLVIIFLSGANLYSLI